MKIGQADHGADANPSLNRLVRQFQVSVDGIQAVAVTTGDGLPLASVLGEEADPDRFGAMCASLLALAEQAGEEVSRGSLRQVMVEGEEGTMLLVQAGPDSVLAVAASPAVNLGRVFHETRRIAEEASVLLDSGGDPA